MITTFIGRVIDWYMKFLVVPVGTPQKKLDEINIGLTNEFKKSKLYSQCIVELKEIKKSPNILIWDFNQRFKTLMAKVSFHMSNVQHKEWFIYVLLPHIYVPLM